MSRSVTVKAVDLTRVLVNMDLWLVAGYLHVDEDGIRGYSTDGFVAMADVCELQGKSTDWLPGDDYLYKVDEDDLDHLLLITRKIGAKPLEITCEEDCLYISGYVFKNEGKDEKPKWVLEEREDAGSSFGTNEDLFPEWIHLLIDSVTVQRETISTDSLAFRPERFLKLSRVRSDNLAPIDMVFVPPVRPETPGKPNPGPMVLVRIGNTFRAIVNSVNRDVAISNLQEGQESWFWNLKPVLPPGESGELSLTEDDSGY